MRIALVAPLYETVPPTGYGGTERVVAALADELVARGHDVTLFAASGSRTAARLEPMAPAPLRTTMTKVELEQLAPHLHLRMLQEVYHRQAEFDLIHSHVDVWTLPFIDVDAITPTLLTMHGRLDIDLVQQIVPRYPHVDFVSISDDQRRPLRHQPVRWAGTCYNGLQLEPYLQKPLEAGSYLAFVGRITAEKRPDRAIEIANAVGLPLKIAAKIDPMDVAYWTQEIKPLLTRPDIEFVGEINEAEKPEFYAGALATLFPIDWPEPFGLVMVESLAAGTPVIAMGHGSVPEILTHGTSGFICDSVADMIAATGRAAELDPRRCRLEARRFTASAMADQYEALYRRSVDYGPPSRPVIDLRRTTAPT